MRKANAKKIETQSDNGERHEMETKDVRLTVMDSINNFGHINEWRGRKREKKKERYRLIELSA